MNARMLFLSFFILTVAVHGYVSAQWVRTNARFERGDNDTKIDASDSYRLLRMHTGFIPDDKSLNLETSLFATEDKHGRYNGFVSLVMSVMINGRAIIHAGVRDHSDKSASVPVTFGALLNVLKSEKIAIGVGFSLNTINTTFHNKDPEAALTSAYVVGTFCVVNSIFISVLGGGAVSSEDPLGITFGTGIRYAINSQWSFVTELHGFGTESVGNAWVFGGGRYCADAYIFELGYGILSEEPGLLLNIGLSL
jgi:hypothetical protein